MKTSNRNCGCPRTVAFTTGNDAIRKIPIKIDRILFVALFLFTWCCQPSIHTDLTLLTREVRPTDGPRPMYLDWQFIGYTGDAIPISPGEHRLDIHNAFQVRQRLLLLVNKQTVQILEQRTLRYCDPSVILVQSWQAAEPVHNARHAYYELKIPSVQISSTPYHKLCMRAGLMSAGHKQNITVLSEPPGAKIYANEEEFGIADGQSAFEFHSEPEQTRLLLRKPGYINCVVLLDLNATLPEPLCALRAL
ncbi:MAG: hypothetical protein KDK27_01880 [Leptospiraceae bacterium]|nr:hypothetical protein [Leptospiraceae bacterium]